MDPDSLTFSGPGDGAVIITGGARGIGFGIASVLAARGVPLALVDVDGEAARQSADDLAGTSGSRVRGYTGDVTERASLEAAMDAVAADFGILWGLVNNAGICPFVDVMAMDEATFRRTLDVNLTGAFTTTQLVARRLIDQGHGGRVVFITSLSANVTAANQADYGASKAGLNMLMKGFALSLGQHGITCNAVAPGIILTDMGREHWEKPENQAFIQERVAVGRIGEPLDIGRAVAWFLSRDSGYVNGTSLIVDGGHQAACR